MSQRWCDLLFAHWPLPAAVLRPHIPARLEIDTFEGSAWIAAVPFRMEAVRPRFLPAVPGLSNFPELNLRTYVTLDDRPGVFFFSLDATNPIAVEVARRVFRLPYFRARMSCKPAGEALEYRSTRAHTGFPAGRFEARYGPDGDVFLAAAGTLEHFLTERYCLYAHGSSVGSDSETLFRGEVHHVPWPLQPARAAIAVNTLLQSSGLEGPTEQPPHLLFARRIDVRVWPPYRV